jgi:hypothetical protein
MLDSNGVALLQPHMHIDQPHLEFSMMRSSFVKQCTAMHQEVQLTVVIGTAAHYTIIICNKGPHLASCTTFYSVCKSG